MQRTKIFRVALFALIAGSRNISLRRGAALAAVTCICAPPLTGQDKGLPLVKLMDRGFIELQVLQNTRLDTVLEHLCTMTQARCEGLPQTSGFMLPPITLSGEWTKVVDKLLEGAGLNYSAAAPKGGQPGWLVIQQRAKASNSASIRNDVPTLADVQANTASSSESHEPTEAVASDPIQSYERYDSQSLGSNSGRSAWQTPAAASGAALNSPALQAGSTSVQRDRSTSVEPFPGIRGILLPVSPEQQSFEPFPDARGQKIPLRPETQSIEPFPDKNGRPIPVHPSANP